jgi:vancomycin resistance protein YoaR
MTSTRDPGRTRRGSIYLGVAGGLFAVSGALVGGYFFLGSDARADSNRATPRHADGSAAPAAADPGDLGHQVADLLDDSVSVVIAGQTVSMRWSDLGVVVDDGEISHSAARAASDEPIASLKTAGALPLRIDREAAIAALVALKGRHDRAAIDARLDLEAKKIRAEQPGFGIDVYASLPRIETAARSGAATVELAGVALPAHVTQDALGIDDISNVLGHWDTKFSVSDKDRNFNLKLAASKLNGHVIPANGDFSFNETVGERTEKQGYKIAHVIQAGEMVDGLAGGTCQISSTLFSASFFAGLDITETHNHSRPSVYQPVGFDSTVVYPTADLKLHNPFPFPVAIHYVVANGEARAEILGKPRPYDKVVFERHVNEETPYESEERLDSTMPEGTQIFDQPGFNGYRMVRYRRMYKDGVEVKTDKWQIKYSPVTEYIRKGTNPDLTLPPPEQPKIQMPKVPTAGGQLSQ